MSFKTIKNERSSFKMIFIFCGGLCSLFSFGQVPVTFLNFCCPTSGTAVTLKSGRREVPGSNPGRACRSSRSEFSAVFSETRVNTGQDPLERHSLRAFHLQAQVPSETIGLNTNQPLFHFKSERPRTLGIHFRVLGRKESSGDERLWQRIWSNILVYQLELQLYLWSYILEQSIFVGFASSRSLHSLAVGLHIMTSCSQFQFVIGFCRHIGEFPRASFQLPRSL